MSAFGARSRSRFARRAREQRTGDAEQAAGLLEREEVLFCERLRRRHQRALLSCLDRAQQGVERDDGLPGSDFALKKALHRHAALEVAVEVGDRALLVLGQPKRQDVAVACDQLAGRAERRCDLRLALAAPAREPDLEQQQLVEGKPAPPGLCLGERAGTVQCPERIHSLGQRFTLLEVGRERVRQRSGQRGADELAQLLRRDVLTRGVDRSEVRGRLALADVEAAHVEPVAPLTTAQAHRRSRLELVFEPRLVEPGGGNGRGAVADARGQHLQSPSPPSRGRQHFTGDCYVHRLPAGPPCAPRAAAPRSETAGAQASRPRSRSPRRSSLFFTVGPTPERTSTERSSSSARGNVRRRGHCGASAPPNALQMGCRN